MSYVDLEIAAAFGPPPKTYNGQPVKFRGSFHHHNMPSELLAGVYFLYPSGSGYVYIDEAGKKQDWNFGEEWAPQRFLGENK